MGLFEEYTLFVDHTQRLSERRQNATQTFLTINTGIFTILAFLFKDAGIQTQQVALASLPLFTAGLVVCWLWHRIITQYKALIAWRYTQLREMERQLPDSYRMFTREWDDLYRPRDGTSRFDFSGLEQQLPRVFGALFISGMLLVAVWWLSWI